MYIKQWLEQDLTKIQCFILIDSTFKIYKSYPEIPKSLIQDVYDTFINLRHSDELEASMKDTLAISQASGKPVQNFGQTDSLIFEGVNNRLAITIFNNLAFISRKKHYEVYNN